MTKTPSLKRKPARIVLTAGCIAMCALLEGGCSLAPTAAPPTTVLVGTTGKLHQMAVFYTLNADCSLDAYPTVTVVQGPAHGSVTVENSRDFPSYAAGSQRFECNRKRVDVRSVKYLASPGYVGNDVVLLDVIWPNSTASHYRYEIRVGSTAAQQGHINPVITRTVPAGAEQRLDYVYSINPDCTPTGDIAVQTLQQPEHGTLKIEPAEVYTDFPKTNVRYDCNRQKSRGMAVRYRSSPGYAGSDAARIEVRYPDETVKEFIYEISVQ